MDYVVKEIIIELKKREGTTKKRTHKKLISSIIHWIQEKVESIEDKIDNHNLDLIDRFLADKQLSGCSKGTIMNYRLELHVFKNSIQKTLTDISDVDIKNYLSSFTHLKKSTLTTKLSVLRTFFSYLVDEEIIFKNPLKKIKKIKEEKKQPKYLNMDELLQLREAIGDNLRLRSIFEFLYETGCRLSEIVDLNIDQIDWTNRSVLVKGKGSKERTVFFHTSTHYYLKKYLESRLDKHPALFITKIGEPRRMHPRTVQAEFKELGSKAGIGKKFHPHMLRHTFSTHLLNKGMDIATLAELLGHEKLSTTQIYAKITEQRKKEAYHRYIS